MWLVGIFSEGDLLNDDYLNQFAPENIYSDDLGYKPRYLDDIDLQLRKELIDDSIKRLQEEKKLIEKYDDKLIGITSWDEIL